MHKLRSKSDNTGSTVELIPQGYENTQLLQQLQTLHEQLAALKLEQATLEQEVNQRFAKQAEALVEHQQQQEQQFAQLLRDLREGQFTLPEIGQHVQAIVHLREEHAAITQALSELKTHHHRQADNQDLLTASIQHLETSQRLLLREYEARQAIVNQQQYIADQPELQAFYQRVQLKLTELFLACKVINSQMVERKTDKVNNHLTKAGKVAGVVDQLADSSVISIAGSLVDLAAPGTGLMVKIAAKCISLGAKAAGKGLELGNTAHSKREGNKIAKISELTVSLSAMDQLVEETARLLALRYETQITALTLGEAITGMKSLAAKADLAAKKQNGGVEDLAECAVGRILEGMRSGQIDAAKATPLTEQLLQTVFHSNLKQGIPLLGNKKIETKEAKVRKWHDHGIFQNSGLYTEKGQCYQAKAKQDYCRKPDKYGYRYGTETEAKHLRLQAQPGTEKTLHRTYHFWPAASAETSLASTSEQPSLKLSIT